MGDFEFKDDGIEEDYGEFGKTEKKKINWMEVINWLLLIITLILVGMAIYQKWFISCEVTLIKDVVTGNITTGDFIYDIGYNGRKYW